jgi:DNA-binding FadR family transcriptional regulator
LSQPPAARAANAELRSVSDLVFDTLFSRIVGGALGPGDSLPGERKLSVDLGVNRGAVREGLKRLEQVGLVSIQHGGPTRVLDFRRCPRLGLLADALELPDGRCDGKVARSVLELHCQVAPHVARLAAQRAGAKLAQALESHLRDLRRSDEDGDVVAHARERAELWCTLARGSANLAYMLATSATRKVVGRAVAARDDLAKAIPKDSVASLSELAFAVVAGDGDLAERHARAALESVEDTFVPRIDARLATGGTRFGPCPGGEPAFVGARESVSQRLFDSLCDRILTEAIPAGSALPGERVLAAEFGINRGAVREALKRVEQLHLISIQHGGATRVLDYRDSPALELLVQSLYAPSGNLRGAVAFGLLEMQTRVVPDIARLAALRSGEGLRDALEETLSSLDCAPDAATVQRARARFWDLLAAGSDNLAYRYLTAVVIDAERRLRADHRARLTSVGLSSSELRPVADAVVAGDGPRAAREAAAAAALVERRAQEVLIALSTAGQLD